MAEANQPLSETDIAIVAMVTHEFLKTNKPTLRKPLLLKTRSPEALDRLSRWSILASSDLQTFLPKALAFHYCGDADALLLAKRSVETLARVLIALYPDFPDDKWFSVEELENECRKMFGNVDPQQVRLGLYLAQEFSLHAGYQGQQTEIQSIRIAERVVEIEHPETLWDDHIKRQTDWISTQVGQIVSARESKPNTDEKYGGWQIVKPLGNKTGQSDVFLVRSPQRVAELAEAAKAIQRYAGGISIDQAPAYASAILQAARADLPSELGALKVFKKRADDSRTEREVLDRLRGEIHILNQNRPGLLKLLASNENERWIITQFQPNGTLEDHILQFQGDAVRGLKAFRPLVQAVAKLHSEGIVHRDIKPANVFVGSADDLILGDFGIVYLPEQPERVTRTLERVGPLEYMPVWADLGERLEKVEPNFDVYMLGKLLWCMVAGKLKLPREYHQKSEFDLTQIYAGDPHMYVINAILSKCVVEESKECLPDAGVLLIEIELYLDLINQGGQLLRNNVPRPCRICGMGFYQPMLLAKDAPVVGLRLWIGGSDTTTVNARLFVCSHCKHIEFFGLS